ncbi:MAG: hypothetical protein EOM23_05975, partial [Candidatus Moranbacteria bacterium]|nr:hypothetical protein [Candidatus Moranbacteria bacterium]
PQTGFSFIAQSRSDYPDPIGGIFWYGVDDTYTNVYFPLYVGMQRAPVSLTTGNILDFEWNSAFWVFNLLANYAYGIYGIVIDEIKAEQLAIETRSHALTKAVDMAAKSLWETDKKMALEYLTDFSVNNAEYGVDRWRKLAFHIFTKYNDRYIRTEDILRPWPTGINYPEEVKRRAVQERPGFYDVRWRKPGEKVD